MNYTTAYLYNTPLCTDGSYTMDFNGISKKGWFDANCAVATYENCYYVRKDEELTIGENADVLDSLGVNYVCYKNDGGTQIFAFVTKIEYKAEKTTVLHLKTDSFITYQDKIVRTEAFIEREHVYDDSLFTHLLDEPVSIGNVFKSVRSQKVYSGDTEDNWNNNFIPVIFCKEPVTNYPYTFDSTFLGGILNPCCVYGVEDINNIRQITTRINNGVSDVQEDDEGNKSIKLVDNIIGIGIGVKELLQRASIPPDAANPHVSAIDVGYPYHSGVISWRPSYSTINGHTVRNNKLNTKQFRYFELTDRSNSTVAFNFENLSYSDTISVDCIFNLGLSSSLSWLVHDYNNTSRNLMYAVTSDIPQMPYQTDSYANWEAANSNKISMENTANAIKSISAVASGNISSIVGAGLQIGATISARKDIKSAPDTYNGNVGGSVAISTGEFGVAIVECYGSTDVISSIDDFFDRYGYNVSKTAQIQWDSRPHYNYVKTQNANISGQIPQQDKANINALLNAGLTVWHMGNGASYGVFDDNNYAPIR